MKILNTLYQKYDKIKEPNRFLIMLCLVLPAVTVLSINSIDASVRMVALAYLLILLGTRMYYLGSKNG